MESEIYVQSHQGTGNRTPKFCSPSEKDILAKEGFKVVYKIYEGGFSKVVKCLNARLRVKSMTEVACKIISTRLSPNEYVNYFLPRDLDVLLSTKHPRLATILGIIPRDHRLFIFMKYEENGDLLNFILSNDPISEDLGRLWCLQLAEGLEYLHCLRIVHRGITCENVLITESYDVKLCNFSFSRRIPESITKKKTFYCLTRCGCLSYVCPEILLGIPYDGELADSYSLGVVVFAILNKALPYKYDNISSHVKAQRSMSYKLNPLAILSDDAKTVIKYLLHPSPQRRWFILQLLESSWLRRCHSGSEDSYTTVGVIQKKLNWPQCVYSTTTLDENSEVTDIDKLEEEREGSSLMVLKNL